MRRFRQKFTTSISRMLSFRSSEASILTRKGGAHTPEFLVRRVHPGGESRLPERPGVGLESAVRIAVVGAVRPEVCRSCEPGDDACQMARRRFGLTPIRPIGVSA